MGGEKLQLVQHHWRGITADYYTQVLIHSPKILFQPDHDMKIPNIGEYSYEFWLDL